MTARQKAQSLATRGLWVTAIAVVALAGVFVRAIAYTPMDRLQGPAQKIYYVHVPAAVVALLAFSLTGVLSIVFLWLKDRRLDQAAAASAEVGVALSVIMLTTGPIWGKPIWGTWWTWDARLTSTLFLFLLFIGYLLMRGAVDDQNTRARFSAVIGVLGLALVPFIHLTVYLFRTLHPRPIVLKPSRPSLPDDMLLTLLLSFGVFVLLYLGFTMQRYALGQLRDLREEELHGAA
jgi:heme exporter protein C